ncbi:glycoside hydrolase family 18 protein [Saccharata proteae CBS 121410]|uniref:Glycoside hydrolase family 18 protein n=1 Tax=Saccharata proteae CBS 121410 TaxID=1314787 RepID=A0A9P4LZ63_9PEZI|nr:glycoside hydrolase family 18 protein [Saccharata proteae CBS 121410]
MVEPNTPVATPSDAPILSMNPGGPNHRITTVAVSYSEMVTSLGNSAEATILPLESAEPLETILPVAPAPTFSIFNQTVDGWNYTSHGSNNTHSAVSDGTTIYTSTQHITIMVTAHGGTPIATPTYPSLDWVLSQWDNDIPLDDEEESTSRIDTTDFNASASDNIAVYHHYISDYLTNETSLTTLCQNTSINIINLPLITGFNVSNGYPMMPTFPGCDEANSAQQMDAPDLRSCPSLASSILACQALGKKVLISISNSAFANDGSTSAPNTTFTDPEQAKTLVSNLWNLFGSATQPLAEIRPFGPATYVMVDGFGIDDALDKPYYDVLAQSFRSHFDELKTWYLSTSQPCASPPSTKVADIVSQEIDFVYLRTQGAANSACAANLTRTVTEWNAALSEAGTGKVRPKNSPGSSASADPTQALFIGSMAWPADGTDGDVEVPYRDPVFVEKVEKLYGDVKGVEDLGGLAFWPGGDDMGDWEGWEGVEGYLQEVKEKMDE